MNRNAWVFWEMERKDDCWLERGYTKLTGKWQKINSLDDHCAKQRYYQAHYNQFKE